MRQLDAVTRLYLAWRVCLAVSFSILFVPVAHSQQNQVNIVDSVEQFLAKQPYVVLRLRCSTERTTGAKENAPNSSVRRRTSDNLDYWPICGYLGKSQNDDSISYFGPRSAQPQGAEADFDKYNSDFAAALVRWHSEAPLLRAVRADDDVPYFVLSEFNSALRPIDPRSRFDDTREIRLHPVLNYRAYIDDHFLKLSYGSDLFSVDGTTVRIPGAWFEVRSAPAATNLEEYNDPTWGKPNATKCGDGAHFAILAHEPHADAAQEALLFTLLKYLQDTFPSLFSQLVVFQEGQYAPEIIANKLTGAASVPPQSSDRVDALIGESHAAWKSASYEPLSKISISDGTAEIVDRFGQFLQAKRARIDLDVAKETLATHIRFYRSVGSTGSLDPSLALANLFTNKEGAAATELRRRLDGLKPHDANFASFLIKKASFRGALAYKFYVEGKIPETGSNSVKIFGIENAGLYLASCSLNEDCLASVADLNNFFGYASGSEWKKIQPYRDWLMANYVLEGLKIFPSSTIPVVLASVRTHLPIIRELLCRKGLTGVMLAPSPDGADEAVARLPELPTTPFSPLFQQYQSVLSAIAPPGGVIGSLNGGDVSAIARAFTQSPRRPDSTPDRNRTKH